MGLVIQFCPVIRPQVFLFIKNSCNYEAIVKDAAFTGAMFETRRYFWL